MAIETAQSLQNKTLRKGLAHAIALIDENHELSNVLSLGVRGILAKALSEADEVSRGFLPDKRVVTDDNGRIIGAQG